MVSGRRLPHGTLKISRLGIASAARIRLGFVPLIDAAPLIAALELDYFSDEGLAVTLERQIGWGNVRDKLSYGHLQASHALLGMPLLSAVRSERFIEPLVSIVALGGARNAITFSRRLTDAGITSAARLLADRSRKPVLSHVFGCSIHHYLLREWLVSGGVDPDRDVQLIVLPPPQMARQLTAGMIDGFCAGDPWNTLAEAASVGTVVAGGSTILPGHPDKVLAVTARWLRGNDSAALALVRAILRGWHFVQNPDNRPSLAEMLARPHYLDLGANLLIKSLSLAGPSPKDATAPTTSQAQWLLKQMIHCGHVPALSAGELPLVAHAAVEESIYQRAMESMEVSLLRERQTVGALVTSKENY